MVFKGDIFGGGCWNNPDPYLNSTTILFDRQVRVLLYNVLNQICQTRMVGINTSYIIVRFLVDGIPQWLKLKTTISNCTTLCILTTPNSKIH